MTRIRGAGWRQAGPAPKRTAAVAAVRPALIRACAVLACAACLLITPAATVGEASTQATPTAHTVMILLDNNSSAGWLAVGRRAALAYVRALPLNVPAGLITFATGWRLVVRPTTNRQRLEAAVSAVQGAAGSYYDSDGIRAALARVTSAVPRLRVAGSRLVVISCAENLGGPPLAAPIPADVIMQHLDADDNVGMLSALAAASDGHLASPQHAAALAAATFYRPPKIHPRTHQIRPKPRGVSSNAVSGNATSRWPWSLVVGAVALFAALFLLVLVALGWAHRASEQRDLAGRIEQYGPRHPTAAPTAEAGSTKRISQAAQDMTSRLMTPAAQERLAERLDLAGVARRPAEWALLGGCLGVILAAALSLITSYVLIGVLAGAILGWLAMRMTLSIRIVRRRTTFGEQLPDTLQLIASALRSGFSLAQAVDAVVREDAQPLAGEFSRALAEVRLGRKLEDSLEAVANRMDSDDLRWTVMAVRIQQGVGGNLAEVLLTIAATIRERAFLRRHVHALSAEGRLSAYILIALPILIGAWLFISAPLYMRTLYTTSAGKIALTAAAVLIVVGALWMRKTIKVKI